MPRSERVALLRSRLASTLDRLREEEQVSMNGDGDGDGGDRPDPSDEILNIALQCCGERAGAAVSLILSVRGGKYHLAPLAPRPSATHDIEEH